MIEGLKDHSQFIYHYTKASTALNQILPERCLRLGSYIRTNDPKETKAWEFDVGSNENRDLNGSDVRGLSSWLSTRLKQKTKMACFSQDAAPLTGDHLSDIFNRGFCKPRMWAQYAEAHNGVCLVFSKQKLTRAIKAHLRAQDFSIAGPVRYVDRSVIPNLFTDNEFTINLDVLSKEGKDSYVERHIQTHYQRLFFEKMTDWHEEQEWRWVVFTESDADMYVRFAESLVGIMFGEHTDEDVVRKIMALTESYGLHYMGLRWKNHSPWYDFGNMRYIPRAKGSDWGKSVDW